MAQKMDERPGKLRMALLTKDVGRRAGLKELSKASAVEPRPRNNLLPQLNWLTAIRERFSRRSATCE